MPKEIQIGGFEFTSASLTNKDPYIIALFGNENCGKTRFPMTGPETIAYLPLEMKSYVTLDKDSKELGKRIIRPSNPLDVIVRERQVGPLDNVGKQKFYKEHVAKVKETFYKLLEHKDARVVVMDKFTTFCTWTEYAINGMTPNYVKIEGKVMQSKSEVRQSCIDFVNSLSQFGKTVVLNCAAKGDYEVLNSKGEPVRDTWDCGAFYMLGSHANLVCELADNKYWDMSKNGDKYEWHYELNVRRCQKRPELEGPMGQPLLRDDMITLPGLIQEVEGDEFDVEAWL